MDQLENALKRVMSSYEAYEDELNSIEDSEEGGMLDTSVLCSIANSTPFLVSTIRQLKNEKSELESVIGNIEEGYRGSGVELDEKLDEYFHGGKSPLREGS